MLVSCLAGIGPVQVAGHQVPEAEERFTQWDAFIPPCQFEEPALRAEHGWATSRALCRFHAAGAPGLGGFSLPALAVVRVLPDRPRIDRGAAIVVTRAAREWFVVLRLTFWRLHPDRGRFRVASPGTVAGFTLTSGLS